MHPHNRFFGQAEILSAHAQLRVDHAVPPPVPGHLQHSWDLAGACSEDRSSAGMPALVWSASAAGRLGGNSATVVIGAPWMYLLSREHPAPLAVPSYRAPDELRQERLDQRRAELSGTLTEQLSASTDRRDTLFMPDHALGGPRAAADLARAVVGHGRVTVVLSQTDHLVSGIRAAYEEQGMPVTSLGDRIRPAGVTGPGVLESLAMLVAQHSTVASNRWRTAHLYAAAAGLKAILVGRTGASGKESPAARGALSDLADDREGLTSYARAELGAQHVLPPDELAALFDWIDRP